MTTNPETPSAPGSGEQLTDAEVADNRAYNRDLAEEHENKMLPSQSYARQPMTAVSEKPPVIDAATFVRDNYKVKIEAGECQVFRYAFERDAEIIDIEPSPLDQSVLVAVMVNDEAMWDTILDDDHKLTVEWLPQPDTAPAQPESEAGEAIKYTTDWAEKQRKGAKIFSEWVNKEAQSFNELCEREIVKIRQLTLKDDEYTHDLLGEAVGSPTGITMCVEARMKQIADQQAQLTEQAAVIASQQARLQAAGKLVEALEPMILAANNLLGGCFKTTVDLDNGSWIDAYFDPYEDKDGKALDRATKEAAAALSSWQQAADRAQQPEPEGGE